MILPPPRSVDVSEGEQAVADGRMVVYFRKGCAFCERLRLALGRRGRRAVGVDIRKHPDGAAYVRSVNDDDETVPTVVIDGRPHINTPSRLVRAALAS